MDVCLTFADVETYMLVMVMDKKQIPAETLLSSFFTPPLLFP
jgi:hypothetical protein